MKPINKIVLSIIIFTLSIAIISFIFYMNKFTDITLSYKDKFGNVKIVNIETGKSILIKNNQEIRVEKGEYSIDPQSDEVVYNGENIKIDGSQSNFSIDLSYSKDKLASLLNSEKTAIESSMVAKFPNIFNLYTIENGSLYGEGNIYGANLIYNNPTAEFRDTLKIVLHKKDNKWEIITNPPQQLLSKEEYPDIDKSILSEINRL